MSPGVTPSSQDHRDIPAATVARLPVYLRALHGAASSGITKVSSDLLAAASGVRSTLLRKDLSHLGSHGVRGVGYDVGRLTGELTSALGLNRSWPMAIVGMGNLGRALAAYSGFATEGFHVVALVDHDPELVGERIGSVTVSHLDELPLLVERLGIAVGVIATPAGSAQQVGEALVSAGIDAVLNFAPTSIRLPKRVSVRTVDLATELHVLAFQRRHAELSGADSGGWIG